MIYKIAVICKVTEKKIVCERWSTITKANRSNSEKEITRREVNEVYEL